MSEEKLDIFSALNSHVEKVLQKSEKPNILLLFTDQQRSDTINACGNPHMITPNLDELVRDGRTYCNAYSPNPICCPARHNLITGLTARHHSIADNQFAARCERSLPTIAEILSDNGYHTRAIGKMHFQPARRHNGFEKLEMMEEVPEFYEDDEYLMYLRQQGYGNVQNIHGVRNMLYMVPQTSLIPEEHLGSKWVADRVINYLDTKSDNRPYFVFAGWIAPHPPFNVPSRFKDIYQDAVLPLPLEKKSKLPNLTIENGAWADFPNEEYERKMRECYYAQITFIDEQIGRIIAKLKESGEYDNTLIIFSSDHGEMLSDMGCYQKFLPYDGSSKIPLVVRYPKETKAGEICEEFADLNDFLPTMLDVAGVEYPEKHELPGESFFAKNKIKERDTQYVEYSDGSRRWVSLRDKNYKYVYYYGGGHEELFDMTVADGESYNLVEHECEKYIDIKKAMRAKLIEKERKYGLLWCIENDDFVVLDEYQANPHRNSAFPIFPKTIKNKLGFDFYEEVEKAVSEQDVVNLSELDIANLENCSTKPTKNYEIFIKKYRGDIK